MIGNFEEQFKQTFGVDQATKNPAPELYPELAKCVEDLGVIPALRHPLYTVAPFCGTAMEIKHANGCYEWALKRSEACLEAGDLEGYVFTHARPYRLDAMVKAVMRLDVSDEDYWRCVRRVWVDSEGPSVNLNLWQLLFFTFRGGQHMMMKPDELEKLSELPETFTVYRGGSRSGLSWTLFEEKARWFANRFARTEGVYKAIAQKSDIVALFLSLGEGEVLLDPNLLVSLERI